MAAHNGEFHRLYCRIVARPALTRLDDDQFWLLDVFAPRQAGFARHYWNLVKSVLLPTATFHETHPRPPPIIACFPRDASNLSDADNYVTLDFVRFDVVDSTILLYPFMVVANQEQPDSFVLDLNPDDPTNLEPIDERTEWLRTVSAGYVNAVVGERLYEYLLVKLFEYYSVFPLLAPAMDNGTDVERERQISEMLLWIQHRLFNIWADEIGDGAQISTAQGLAAIQPFPVDTNLCPLTARYCQHLVLNNV
ncbi:hypothetical protein C8J56DRAFT_1052847 [Mycena floridula]|nr:hypothetical protein C8J56DRAFT_1052847 [Mycena floridula]